MAIRKKGSFQRFRSGQKEKARVGFMGSITVKDRSGSRPSKKRDILSGSFPIETKIKLKQKGPSAIIKRFA